ncbi:uncharacterized protein LOC111913205 isoform X2 [Lactuca sativa]|uniref:uncharacterized protein LOC111913205 isoform X2 n=1 Tax=Lactuca sativa TaxID=4236 RepID=UPI0022AFDF37|nr:uncharacterized protein LOC111913205 isoform X2 [Lactuca sativa]
MASFSAFITRVQSYSELSNLSKRSLPSNVFKFSSSFQTRITHTHHHGLKLKHLLKAAPEGPPSELIEDSKFVPLNPDDPTFGPPAMLLTGFQVDEVVKIQKFLKELDGEFVEVIFCTEDMMKGSLWEAVNTKQPNLEASKVHYYCKISSKDLFFIWSYRRGDDDVHRCFSRIRISRSSVCSCCTQ